MSMSMVCEKEGRQEKGERHGGWLMEVVPQGSAGCMTCISPCASWQSRYFDAMHGYLHESRSAAAPAPTVLQYWSLRADNHPVPKAPDFLLCSTVQS